MWLFLIYLIIKTFYFVIMQFFHNYDLLKHDYFSNVAEMGFHIIWCICLKVQNGL